MEAVLPRAQTMVDHVPPRSHRGPDRDGVERIPPAAGSRSFLRPSSPCSLHGRRSISGSLSVSPSPSRSENQTQISVGFPMAETAGRGHSAGPHAFPAARSPGLWLRPPSLSQALQRDRLHNREHAPLLSGLKEGTAVTASEKTEHHPLSIRGWRPRPEHRIWTTPRDLRAR